MSNSFADNLKDIPNYIKKYAHIKDYPQEKHLDVIGAYYGIPKGLLFAMFWKESLYTCDKTSQAQAKGCFQFIDETAVDFGLKGDNYDYRSNAWLSSDAAARYLRWNFQILGLTDLNDPDQWAFAVAAYNAGPGKIKTNDGLVIPMYTETQYYVEDIIGYVKGYKHIVKPGDTLNEIASDYKIHSDTLNLLNSKNDNSKLYKGSFITVRSPKRFYRYVVKKGDSLSHIAEQTGVSIQLIGKTNSIKSLSSIEVGQTLYLPVF